MYYVQHVGTSTEPGRLGENAVIHLRSNFGFQVYRKKVGKCYYVVRFSI
jgi:hypothetical protein